MAADPVHAVNPSASPPRPHVPGPVRAATEVAFAGLARLRNGRAFHPRGRSLTATFTPLDGQPLSFLGTDPRPALVRLSNAAGLPAWSPDVRGLAIRFPDVGGPGRHQDLLLASSRPAPGLRHLLVPSRGFDAAWYSTLLLYRHQRALRLLGACYSGPALDGHLQLDDVGRAARDGTLAFTLALASPGGRWQPIGTLQAVAPLAAARSRQLRFHPWLTAPELQPVGPLNHLRARAYEASQRAATSE